MKCINIITFHMDIYAKILPNITIIRWEKSINTMILSVIVNKHDNQVARIKSLRGQNKIKTRKTKEKTCREQMKNERTKQYQSEHFPHMTTKTTSILNTKFYIYIYIYTHTHINIFFSFYSKWRICISYNIYS